MNEALTAARRMRELLDSRVTEARSRSSTPHRGGRAGTHRSGAALAQAEADAAAMRTEALVGLRADEPLTLRESLEALVRVDPASAGSRPARLNKPVRHIDRRASDIREATARVALADAKIEQARREDAPTVARCQLRPRGLRLRTTGLRQRGRSRPVAGTFTAWSMAQLNG